MFDEVVCFWSFSSLLIASYLLPREAPPSAKKSAPLIQTPGSLLSHDLAEPWSPLRKTYDFNIQWSNVFCSLYSIMQMKGSDHEWISFLSGFRWPLRKLSPTLPNCLTLRIYVIHRSFNHNPPRGIWCCYWLSCFQLFILKIFIAAGRLQAPEGRDLARIFASVHISTCLLWSSPKYADDIK